MPETIQESYDSVQKVIHKIVHRFLENKGISKREYNEWHGEACLAFVRSYYAYEPDVEFHTYMWHWVWGALCNKLCKEAPHWKTAQYYHNEEAIHSFADRSTAPFCLTPLVESISEDAEVVVRLVVGATGLEDGEQEDYGEIRCRICSMLESLGWSFARIVEAFNEIKTVLLTGGD